MQILQPHSQGFTGHGAGPAQVPVPSRDRRISCSAGSWWLCQSTGECHSSSCLCAQMERTSGALVAPLSQQCGGQQGSCSMLEQMKSSVALHAQLELPPGPCGATGTWPSGHLALADIPARAQGNSSSHWQLPEPKPRCWQGSAELGALQSQLRAHSEHQHLPLPQPGTAPNPPTPTTAPGAEESSNPRSWMFLHLFPQLLAPRPLHGHGAAPGSSAYLG